MSAGVAKGAINDATRELMTSWERVREDWRDGKADEFGKQYLTGLGEDTSRVVRVLGELEKLISKVHADCE